MKRHNHRYFLCAIVLTLSVIAPRFASADAAVQAAAFRSDLARLVGNFKELGIVLNDPKLKDEAERAINLLNSTTQAQWDEYAAKAVVGTVPNISAAVSASTQALARVNALASPLQLDQPFPVFGPIYPACTPTWDDPAFIFAITVVQLTLAAVLNVLNFPCATGALGFNLEFVCIGPSVALGVVGVLMDQMSTCRIINGRPSNRTTYDALVYVDNALRQESKTLQTLMDTNTQALIVQLRQAQQDINNFQNILKDSMIAEIGSAITTSQNALVSDTNTSLASVENSIIGTTTSLIREAQNKIVSHSNLQAAAINANTDNKASAILAELNDETKSILENLAADSRGVMNIVLEMGCAELLPANVRSTPSSCSDAPAPYVSTSSTLLGANPVNSGVSQTAVISSGCSQGSAPASLPVIIMLLLSAFALRRRRMFATASLRVLTLGILAASQQISSPAFAQTSVTLGSFRAQYEESMSNLTEYFQAIGNAEAATQMREGLAAFGQLSDEDLSSVFAQVPPDANGDQVPNLHELVVMSQSLVAALPAPQAQPLDLLVPAQGFPPFGKDFCPSRSPDDALYAITVANNVMDVLMSIMTYVCLQGKPFLGTLPNVILCIALAAAQSALNIAYGMMTNCAFLEGGPPVYEALDFIQLDIQNQFATLQEKSNQNTNQLSLQIVETQTSITDTDFAAYNAILAATFANIKAEQNTLIANSNSNMSTIENTVLSTTAKNLADATIAINQNTDLLTAAIIANANAKAADIIARAKSNAKTIMDNVRRDATKILNTVKELSCQGMSAQNGSGVQASSAALCAGQPGF